MHALVTADTVGGVWTYARELVTGLAQRGVRVTLVSFGEIPSSSQTSWLEGLRGVDFRPTAFKLEWMQESEADIEASSEYLSSIIDEVRPDVLHLNQYCYGAVRTNVPKVVVAHSDVVGWWVHVRGEEPRDNSWIRWYRETVTRGLQGADVVIAPTHWMLECIRAYYVEPNRGAVIPNGRNAHFFNPHVTKESYALAVGRLWDAGKQVSLLTQHEPPLPVYIIGSEHHPDPAFRHAATHEGQTGFHFEGPKSEGQLRQLYSRAAIYVATSRYEPFGLAPLEAALSRCAIIANDIPAFHEVWGDSVYYFRYNDADDLARALRAFASNDALRVRFANLAYHRARQLYNAERMIDAYIDVYGALARTEATAA